MHHTSILVLACLLCAVVAHPVPEEQAEVAQSNQKELLDISLIEDEPTARLSDRNKRTIGVLRQLFPSLTQILDRKLQELTSQVIRSVGQLVLRGGLNNILGGLSGGGVGTIDTRSGVDDNSSGGSSSNGRKVSIELPTYPPDLEGDDDDDDDDGINTNTSSPNVDVFARFGVDQSDESSSTVEVTLTSTQASVITDEISIETEATASAVASPTTVASIDTAARTTTESSITTAVTITTEATIITVETPTTEASSNNDIASATDESTKGNLPQSVDQVTALVEENSIGDIEGAGSDVAEIRVAAPAAAVEDQQAAASGGNIDDINLDEEALLADDRNKRQNSLFLPFGVSAGGSVGAGGAAGGGSGNFLFDIIRNTADRAARAAGTVYRVVAGTQSLGLNISASSQTVATTPAAAPPPPAGAARGAANNTSPALVAGSGGTEQTDAGVGVSVSAGAGVAPPPGGDGFTEGIPGPVTRLFVIANRGLSNLIQDLILRIAQTSERIVNFKARLITSII